MDRDPKTGRFLPGNREAVGNKGNRKPKWGNQNALKHGFFTTAFIVPIIKDRKLYLSKKGIPSVVIGPEGFLVDDEGRIRIRNDVAERLEDMGYKLEG